MDKLFQVSLLSKLRGMRLFFFYWILDAKRNVKME